MKNKAHPTATDSIAPIKKNIEGLLNSPLCAVTAPSSLIKLP